MAAGPGKYDDLCTHVRRATRAEAVVLIVAGGERGPGFSAQMADESGDPRRAIALMHELAGELRAVADGLIAESRELQRRLAQGEQFEEYVSHEPRVKP